LKRKYIKNPEIKEKSIKKLNKIIQKKNYLKKNIKKKKNGKE
jgi:hypothetical protein